MIWLVFFSVFLVVVMATRARELAHTMIHDPVRPPRPPAALPVSDVGDYEAAASWLRPDIRYDIERALQGIR